MTFNHLVEHRNHCPYCSEQLCVLIDGSEQEQEYVEDCQVCCQPMVITVELTGDAETPPRVQVRREND